MPVQLRRDEELPTPASARDDGEDEIMLRDALGAAVQTAMLWTVLGSFILGGGLKMAQKALLAADRLLQDPGFHYEEMCMPVVLFAMLGAVFGATLTWWVTAKISIVSTTAWLICIVATLLLCVVGVVLATRIFDDGVPTMAWIALGALAVCSIFASKLVLVCTTA